MEEEIWREIEGYNGKYFVSNFGKIRSNNYQNTGRKHLLKGHYYKRYKRVILSKGKIHDTVLVHYAVAKAFPEICGELFDGCQIHHIDRNTKNNSAINLIVVSKQEHKMLHINDRIEQGKNNFLGKHHTEETKEKIRNKHIGKIDSDSTKEKKRKASIGRVLSEQSRKKLSDKKKKIVLKFDLNGNFICEYPSLLDAANSVNRTHASLIANIKGITNKSGGFIWKYKN